MIPFGATSDPSCFGGTRWLRGAHLFWPREQWQKLQLEELGRHLQHAGTTKLYQGRWASDIRPRFEALGQIPPTTKDDLARAGSEAFGCAKDEVREWVCTSGTSGHPLQVPLTGDDLQRLAANEAVAMEAAGLQQGDTLLMVVGMDRLFVAGLAYWLGAQAIGAACIRAGPQHAGSAAVLSEMFERYHPTHIIAVPSFLAANTGDCDVELQKRCKTLRGILCIGEPIRSTDGQLSPLGQRLHERFGCPILSTYASTEICTTFAEGPQCQGGHLNPQLAVVEILDDDGLPVAAGQAGEVVVTPLGVRGLPLVRFRTGDMAALIDAPCTCGRTTPRLGPILGRRQQLLKVRGTSIYPPAILDALAAIAEVADAVIIATQEHTLSDRVTLHLQLSADSAAVRHAVETRLRAVLRVLPEIVYVDRDRIRDLQFSTGSRKPQRFLDRRPSADAPRP